MTGVQTCALPIYEVGDEPAIAAEADCDPFPDASEFAHGESFHAGERGFHGPKKRHAAEAHALERLPEDARLQSPDVCGDVWKFRHR